MRQSSDADSNHARFQEVTGVRAEHALPQAGTEAHARASAGAVAAALNTAPRCTGRRTQSADCRLQRAASPAPLVLHVQAAGYSGRRWRALGH